VFQGQGNVVYIGSNADGGRSTEGDRVEELSTSEPKGQLLASLNQKETGAAMQGTLAELDTARSSFLLVVSSTLNLLFYSTIP